MKAKKKEMNAGCAEKGIRRRGFGGGRIVRAHPSHKTKARRMGHPQVFLLREEKPKRGTTCRAPTSVNLGGNTKC
jgi:hypothetical protein